MTSIVETLLTEGLTIKEVYARLRELKGITISGLRDDHFDAVIHLKGADVHGTVGLQRDSSCLKLGVNVGDVYWVPAVVELVYGGPSGGFSDPKFGDAVYMRRSRKWWVKNAIPLMGEAPKPYDPFDL